MSVVVQNQTGKPWNIDRTHIIQAGEVTVLDEENWAELPDDLRDVPGGIVALWPTRPLIDVAWDHLDLSNPDVNGNYQTLTFKNGGIPGPVVRVLTFTFDGSGNITSLAKS